MVGERSTPTIQFQRKSAREAPIKFIYYRTVVESEEAQIRAKSIDYDWQGISFDLIINDTVADKVQLQLFGRHNIYNALAAAAIAIQSGLSLTTFYWVYLVLKVLNDALSLNIKQMKSCFMMITPITHRNSYDIRGFTKVFQINIIMGLSTTSVSG